MSPGGSTPAMLAVIVAGCAASAEPYRVDAVADLVALRPEGAGIAGPLEMLGPGAPAGATFRTIAAYRVQLPAGAAPWIRLYATLSCDGPDDRSRVFDDLGLIRRVGDETHFFARDVQVGGRTIDVDIQTVATLASPEPATFGNVFDLIAVAQAPDDGSAVDPSTGQPVPPGLWLACGAFVRP